MNAESKLLIGALRQAVVGTIEELSLDVDWCELLHLARIHMLMPLLYDGLHRNPKDWERVPDEIKNALYKSFLKAIYIDHQIDELGQRLSEKLIYANVPHVFLKGYLLKHNYPVPALRTMCDIDILICTDHYAEIDSIAVSLGGKLGHCDGNHRNYSFPGGVLVEFHPNMLHQDIPVGTQINPGWQYAKKKDGSSNYELTEEGFYLNTICHLANHFVTGGVGVRFVLDVWVNRHLRKPDANRTIVESELKKFGLFDFAQKIEELAELWFGDGEATAVLEDMGEYILSSGSHGIMDREVLNSVVFSDKGTRLSSIVGKVFHSRKEMEGRFPWCKGKPWLLPVAWCVRAFRAVTQRGKLILEWSKHTGKVTNAQTEIQKQRMERYGIHMNKE